MPQLRLRLEIMSTDDHDVSMQIWRMCGSLRGKGELASLNGLLLKSSDLPEIRENVLFVRGNDYSRDKMVVTKRFYEQYATDYIERVHAVLNHFAITYPFLNRRDGEQPIVTRHGDVMSVYA